VIIKKKSLVVALVSSLVISMVLVVNLAGYLIYLELKDDELSRAYRADLQKVNAKVYSEHIEVARLEASFDRMGPLSGEAVLEGIVRNDGYRDITNLCIRVKFLDRDGAAIYEVTFQPLESSLESYGALAPLAASHLTDTPASVMKPESSIPFKKILTNCPREILSELKASAGSSGSKGRWTGRFSYEILSVNF